MNFLSCSWHVDYANHINFSKGKMLPVVPLSELSPPFSRLF